MPMVSKMESKMLSWGLWKIDEDVDFFEKNISYRSSATHRERIRQQLAARMILNELYVDFPFESVKVNENGKPYLPETTIDFSISHSHGFAAAMLSREKQVGIDVEQISDRVLRIEKKFLHKHELQQLDRMNRVQRIEHATLFWSLKESFYKWYGKGGLNFSQDMELLDVEKTESGRAMMKCSMFVDRLFEIQYLRHDDFWLTWICQ